MASNNKKADDNVDDDKKSGQDEGTLSRRGERAQRLGAAREELDARSGGVRV